MTETVIVHTDLPDSEAAGSSLGEQVATALGPQPPDALILFASPKYAYPALLRGIDRACHPKTLVGCSSAGEFTSNIQGQGLACAIALRSDEMAFAVGVGRGLRADQVGAARQLVSSFQGLDAHHYLYRSALLLTDALAGYADELVDEVTLLTAGTYQLFGGGAGDDAQFHRTHIFAGTEAVPDAAVALEILSHKPLGIGVRHGWQPASAPMRVTEAEGMCLVSLNAVPAAEVFQEYAAATGQSFDVADPLPFFLHNIIGIDTGTGHRLRVPLSVNADGSVLCAANIPTGATVHIMSAGGPSAADAAATATEVALAQLQGHRPQAALFFDCVATRLRMGKEFGLELGEIERLLGPTGYVGCNTYGQIARAEGQFSGFHNCTAVICVIPE